MEERVILMGPIPVPRGKHCKTRISHTGRIENSNCSIVNGHNLREVTVKTSKHSGVFKLIHFLL